MTEAKLTFEGMDPLTGTARHGGDFVVFMTNEAPKSSIKAGMTGMVEIDGVTQKVSVEGQRSVDHGDHPASSEFTLRLFTPISG